MLKLNRDLRRDVLRGHPWIYREALDGRGLPSQASLMQLFDKKKQHLAWGIYDPHGPLAFRVLSLEPKAPNNKEYFDRIKAASNLRLPLLKTKTTAYRLINGEGDYLPGLVCDVYGEWAVLQCDGEGPKEFWELGEIAGFLVKEGLCKKVAYKGRGQVFEELIGDRLDGPVMVQELGVQFEVKIREGQKTGFFLDQRDNRSYVRERSQGKKVLNVFSYTGGFSVYAGVGGANFVQSVDLAAGALESADRNWALNDLAPKNHESLCGDAFEILESIKSKMDLVIVDPPSMAPSEKHKKAAMQKYAEAFAAAARVTRSGGDLMVSSCSSHIHFDDFFEIIQMALSKVRRRGQVLRVSGQGMDHPFPQACHELRYLKFVHLVLS